ncbi:MAG: poly(R)-hydroxyalkanoic acid synthase subunit PhaE [Candidatus Methanoperedens sp.]|nr:poly(R)-hydroxyalkanoic acid synthase subunit PhaE [Candidatus Methanoperedens sp.]
MVKKTEVSKMWEDSYLKLYKPWIESTGEMFEKSANLSKEATPQKYKEFYDEWIKTYQSSFGKFYPTLAPESNKETLEIFLSNAERYNKLYRSWIEELEDNSQKTKEILSGKPDAAKYKECHDMWVKSYEKIFDELMELPSQESTKEIFGNYMEVPDIYLGSFLQMSKLFKRSYAQLCKPLNESMMTLSEKMAEISRGDANPEAYKEFYNLWVNTYKETYGKFARSMETNSEMFEHFAQSTNIYLGMYKSWIDALEKMSEKAKELSTQTSDPEAYKEFSNLWLKMYEKAFDSFFDDMPTVGGPMKEVMEPVKIMAKMYADTFIKMSKMWVRSDSHSATAYPGKNKR